MYLLSVFTLWLSSLIRTWAARVIITHQRHLVPYVEPLPGNPVAFRATCYFLVTALFLWILSRRRIAQSHASCRNLRCPSSSQQCGTSYTACGHIGIGSPSVISIPWVYWSHWCYIMDKCTSDQVFSIWRSCRQPSDQSWGYLFHR